MAADPGMHPPDVGWPADQPPMGGWPDRLPPREARIPQARTSRFGAGTAVRLPSRAPARLQSRPAAELTPEQLARLHAREAARQTEAGAAEAGGPDLRRLGEWTRPGPEGLPMRLHNGQIQVRLPFKVDVVRLTERLLEMGYRVAYTPGAQDDDDEYDPDPPGTQCWGPGHDPDGYYPYSIAPDPEAPEQRSLFAFPPRPEDIIEQDVAGRTVARVDPGDDTLRLIDQWIPELAAAALRKEGGFS